MGDDTLGVLRELAGQSSIRVCYVLESGGLADALALERVCEREGLPLPSAPLRVHGQTLLRSLVVLRGMHGVFFRRRSGKQSRSLTRMIELAVAARDRDELDETLVLVPVGIFWGRAPDKKHSWSRLILADGWEVAGRFRKFVTTLALGRQTLLEVSKPMHVMPLLDEGQDAALTLRKASRILRLHFRRRRIATVGPDLSHKRTLINALLLDPPVRRAIAASGAPGTSAHRRAEAKARNYAIEIAADLSYSTVRVLDHVLTWLWQKLYDGVEVSGMQRLKQEADGSELIYVPCHRSHIDYLFAFLCVVQAGVVFAVHCGGDQSESAGGRCHPASRRCVLPAPLL